MVSLSKIEKVMVEVNGSYVICLNNKYSFLIPPCSLHFGFTRVDFPNKTSCVFMWSFDSKIKLWYKVYAQQDLMQETKRKLSLTHS